MTRFRTILFLAILVGLGAFALGQGVVPAMRILSPKAGEKTTNSYVDVQYELSAPVSASGSPTFRLQLDGHDPVETTDTQYTFTGLTPGTHTVSIMAVDANGTPITGTQAQLQFSVVQDVPPPGPKSPGAQVSNSGKLVNASYQAGNSAPQDGGDQKLPNSGSALPLLSVIGMGVLVGGIVSALRTRPSSSR